MLKAPDDGADPLPQHNGISGSDGPERNSGTSKNGSGVNGKQIQKQRGSSVGDDPMTMEIKY